MQKKKLLILSLVLASVLLACFFAFLILVVSNYNFKIDLLNVEIAKVRTSFFNWFFVIFSYLGNFFVLSAIILVLFFIIRIKYKQKFKAWFLIISYAFVSVVNFLIKNVVKRARPELQLFKEFSYSFPSWHAMLTCFVFGVLIFLALKHLKSKPIKIILTVLFGFAIVLMAFARIYLGVHYVSDVLAGLLLGLAFVLVFGIIYNKCFAIKKD